MLSPHWNGVNMTTKELEKRIEKFFSVANNFQNRALSMSKKRFHQALEGEIAARKLATNLFDKGLTLLGKGIMLGRKAKETFSASTNKKSSRLQKLVQPESASENKSASAAMDSKPLHAEMKRKKSIKNLNRKSNMMKKVNPRTKNPRTHTGPVARSH